MLEKAKNSKNAVIFAYNVSEPERYGVVEFNSKGEVVSIEEKPKKNFLRCQTKKFQTYFQQRYHTGKKNFTRYCQR